MSTEEMKNAVNALEWLRRFIGNKKILISRAEYLCTRIESTRMNLKLFKTSSSVGVLFGGGMILAQYLGFREWYSFGVTLLVVSGITLTTCSLVDVIFSNAYKNEMKKLLEENRNLRGMMNGQQAGQYALPQLQTETRDCAYETSAVELAPLFEGFRERSRLAKVVDKFIEDERRNVAYMEDHIGETERRFADMATDRPYGGY